MKSPSTIIIFALFFITLPIFSQSFYTIRGDLVQQEENLPTIAIVYHTNSCSSCMQSLSYFLMNQCKKNKINLVVLIPESNVSIMRAQTTALLNYYDKTEMPLVVYDLNPNNEQQYAFKYKIEHFPCVILFPPNKKEVYISYSQLFGTKNKTVIMQSMNRIKTFIKTHGTT